LEFDWPAVPAVYCDGPTAGPAQPSAMFDLGAALLEWVKGVSSPDGLTSGR